jgi:hypothetical protein
MEIRPEPRILVTGKVGSNSSGEKGIECTEENK